MRKLLASSMLLISLNSMAGWQYSTEKDSMTDENVSYAWLASENDEKVGSIFQSNQKMYLSMKTLEGKGTAVGISFSLEGEDKDPVYYMCKFQVGSPCSVLVRFDNEPAEEMIVNPPPTGGDEIMFFYESGRMYQKLKKSKELRIRASIFNSGEVTYKFNTAGLK